MTNKGWAKAIEQLQRLPCPFCNAESVTTHPKPDRVTVMTILHDAGCPVLAARNGSTQVMFFSPEHKKEP